MIADEVIGVEDLEEYMNIDDDYDDEQGIILHLHCLFELGPDGYVLPCWYNFTSENEYEQDGFIVDDIEEDGQEEEQSEEELQKKKRRKKGLILDPLYAYIKLTTMLYNIKILF